MFGARGSVAVDVAACAGGSGVASLLGRFLLLASCPGTVSAAACGAAVVRVALGRFLLLLFTVGAVIVA